MPVRITEIPGLAPSRINAAPMDPAAAGAPWRDLGELASSIASVSRPFGQIAHQIQGVENARILSEKRLQLSTDFTSLRNDLETDNDPGSRLARVKDFFSTYRSNMDTADMAPVVREELALHYDQFASEAINRQTMDSGRLAMQRGGMAVGNEMAEAKRTGNRTAYQTAMNTGLQAGYILPEQEPALMQDFDAAMSLSTLETAIREEPDLVEQDMRTDDFLQRFPGMSVEGMPGLHRSVRRSMEEHRKAELDTIEAALAREEPVSEAMLKSSRYLTEEDVSNLSKLATGSRPPTSETHAKVWDLLVKQRDSYSDPSLSDEEYAARWNTNRSAIYGMIPSGFRGDISQELSFRSPANRRNRQETSPAPRQPAREDLTATGFQKISRALESGIFGDVSKGRGLFTDKVAYYRRREAAFDVAASLRNQVKNHILTTPGITEADVRKFTGDLIDQALDGGESPIIPGSPPGLGNRLTIPAAPPALNFDGEVDDLLRPGPADGTTTPGGQVLPPKSSTPDSP